MEKFAEKRYQLLLEEIEILPDVKNVSLKNPAAVADKVKAAIGDLKKHFSEYPFPDPLSMIKFFKYQKPVYLAEHIYALEIFTVETNRPQGDPAIIRNYYEQELRFIKRFFDQYRFLYQYYLLDGIELDAVYFTPGSQYTELILPESPEIDTTFAAAGEFLFAKFIAFEKIQDRLINLLFPEQENRSPLPIAKRTPLHWTGDKINLIELAYAIHDTAQINQGHADIVDITNWLEESLNISLSRHYRMFSELKSRKSVSRTRYIDHLKETLVRHLEEGDAFNPVLPKPVSGSKSAYKA